MISAFGIEHSEISKGLPSALRNAPKFASGKNNYVNTRIAANTAGRTNAGSATRNVPKSMRQGNKGYLKGKPSALGQTQRQNSKKFLP